MILNFYNHSNEIIIRIRKSTYLLLKPCSTLCTRPQGTEQPDNGGRSMPLAGGGAARTGGPRRRRATPSSRTRARAPTGINAFTGT